MSTGWTSVSQVELVAPGQARAVLKSRVGPAEGSGLTFWIKSESPIVGGFVAGTVRFPMTWSAGKARGAGFVELVPFSRFTTQLEVCLSKPFGVHKLLWSSDKLRRKASEIALAIRGDFESRREAAVARKEEPLSKLRVAQALAGEG